ncbi:MAG TPA: ATP-binding cassette domain-containing protein [Acidimicrobiales bacterium]|nr:ATP-binding cassette domain-containing protein [Acidimicrobiales bacterium]
MSNAHSNAIEADGLVKTFGADVRALDGLSLAVEEGTVFGLLGPNGAGKTTAVRIFTTTLVPDTGIARVAGYDVVKQADEVRLHIGLAGQFAAVDGNLTGRENLRLIGQLCHLPRRLATARADDLLARFDLTDAAGRPAKTYSGGMRRRLDVAAALVNQPPVLFFDEPTTGLDPQSRNSLWELIEELVRGGTTVLLTTQYLEEADRLADRIAVVDHGKVIAEGTPGELKARLGATVLDLVFTTEDDAVRAAGLFQASWPKPPVRDGKTVELTVEDGPRQVMDALRVLDGAGLEPTGIALREPSLDDVFLTLTGRRAVVETEEGVA